MRGEWGEPRALDVARDHDQSTGQEQHQHHNLHHGPHLQHAGHHFPRGPHLPDHPSVEPLDLGWRVSRPVLRLRARVDLVGQGEAPVHREIGRLSVVGVVAVYMVLLCFLVLLLFHPHPQWADCDWSRATSTYKGSSWADCHSRDTTFPGVAVWVAGY